MEVKAASVDEARALLTASDLPVDDLDDASIELIGAYENGALLGVIGLQTCAGTGLLRSLAVTPAARDRGIARVLCEHVVALARQRQLDGLWLLTTSASEYFVRHGFDVVGRDSAPSTIRATAQFASLCPSSAIVMRRST